MRDAPCQYAGSRAERPRVAQCPIPRLFRSATERSVHLLLLVVVLAALVHATLVARAGGGAPPAKLPPLVVEMRDRLLAAVAAGSIEDLREPLEWNEMPFLFQDGDDAGGDPIAYWKKQSADGEGRDVLADIGRALALPPARLAIGRDAENSAVYVWPYLSERPLDRLSPAEQAHLLTLMPAPEAEAMLKGGRWTWWRLVIGADGTWHALKKDR